jgi:hypothetical protein
MNKKFLTHSIISRSYFGIWSLLVFVLFVVNTHSIFAQAVSSGSNQNGGAWSSASTWSGTTQPGAGVDVTIVTGDSVYTTGAVTCQSLTIQPGAKLVVNVGALTITGGFTIGAGAWFYDNYSMKAWPNNASSYTIDPASNFVVMGSGPSTFGTQSADSTFGSVYILKSGVTCGANLMIQGNLTINYGSTSSAFRGITGTTVDSVGTATFTHHVMGNVYLITGLWSAVDGNNNTSRTPLMCVWNIDGNVMVGDASTASGAARFGPFSSDDGGSVASFGEFNIGGSLTVVNGAKLQAGNSTSNNNINSGEINIGGNLTLDSTVVYATNSNGEVFSINFVGTKTQTVSLGKAVSFASSTHAISLYDTVGAKSTVQFVGNKSWNVNCPGAPSGPGYFVVYGKVLFGEGDTLKGTQNFILKPGGTLGTANVNGIDTTAGSVQVTGVKTFPSTANYVFDGTQAQVTGPVMPATVNDLTIDNAAGVKLSQATTINGVLHLKAGVFDNTVPFTLGSNGTISNEGGSLLITGVKKTDTSIPQRFYVDQNYPNPFNPSTDIQFGVPSKSFVSVKVFNVLGQRVATLVNDVRSAGVYTVNFDAANLSSGVYFYRVQVGNSVETKRMVLMK